METQEGRPEEGRGRRQEKTGRVLRDARNKTVVVEVARLVTDPLYDKVLRRRSRFMAHDEANACRAGDRVRIRETRPLSRHKRWVVREILVKAAAE